MHLFLLIASFIIMPTFCMKNTVLSQQVTAFYDKKITSKEKFKIFAQPAILIVNPNSEEVIKKWSSEPYSMTPDEFVKEAQSAA